MITVKIPYTSSELFSKELVVLRKQYSSIVRYSFNRFHDNIKQKDIRVLLKTLNNINSLDSWLQQCAVMEGNQLFNRFKKQPDIIFLQKDLLKNNQKNPYFLSLF